MQWEKELEEQLNWVEGSRKENSLGIGEQLAYGREVEICGEGETLCWGWFPGTINCVVEGANSL